MRECCEAFAVVVVVDVFGGVRVSLKDGRGGSSLAQAARPPWRKKDPWGTHPPIWGDRSPEGAVKRRRDAYRVNFLPSKKQYQSERPAASCLTIFETSKTFFSILSKHGIGPSYNIGVFFPN